MSNITNIAIKVKAAMEANTTLADSDVFMREPTAQDKDVTKRTVFIYSSEARPGNPELVSTLRVYRVSIEVRTTKYGRTNDPATADDIVTEKGIISDALLVAIATCYPGQTYAVSNIYHIEWVNEDLYYNEKLTKDGIDIGEDSFAVLQQWDFHAFS